MPHPTDPLPFRRRFAGSAFAIVALALLLAPAAAQTSKEAPGRITPSAATSACLGDPATPVCAAETLLACVARGDADLCRKVMAVAPATTSGAPQVEYVVERVSVIRPEHISDDLKDLEWFKPGYTLVEVLRRACAASAANCGDESWEGVQVYLRNRGAVGQAWEVVHWRSEAEPDTPPEEPENFQAAMPPR